MKFKDITPTKQEVIQSLKEVGVEFDNESNAEFEKYSDLATLTYKLLKVATELDVRETTSNCVIKDLQIFGWKELCDYGIELLKQLKGDNK